MERSGVLKWTPSSASASSVVAIDEKAIVGIHISKEGSPQIVLMVQLQEELKVLPNGKTKALFHFNGGIAGVEDREKALRERNAFKDYLAEVVSNNKARTSSASRDVSGTGSPVPAHAGRREASPKSRDSPSGSNTPSSRPPGKKASVKDGPSELEVRIRVLKANPSLAILHQDVVMTEQISDQEFWSHPTRRALLNAERASMEQRQGRNARIADPRPTSNEKGEMKINMTPELVRDLKAQYPVVSRAFEENVPTNMDEPTFWKRYFSSKLYHQLRTSARSQASQHTVDSDDILDKYLEEEDDGIEPRKEYNAHDAFLDLGSTAEDHTETGNEKDWTMRAGNERRTLPLLRRFNDHSQSLLDSALGEQDARLGKRKKGDATSASDSEDDGLVIDDLQDEHRNHRRRLLDMQEQRGLFASSSARGGTEAGGNAQPSTSKLTLDEGQIRKSLEKVMQHWQTAPERYAKGDKNNYDGVMSLMLENIRARREAKHWRSRGELSDILLKKLQSQHGAATEFLRQLWAAIAPQPAQDGSVPIGGANSTSRRKARAQRMLRTLQNSMTGFQQLINTAEREQAEPGRERVSAVSTMYLVHFML